MDAKCFHFVCWLGAASQPLVSNHQLGWPMMDKFTKLAMPKQKNDRKGDFMS